MQAEPAYAPLPPGMVNRVAAAPPGLQMQQEAAQLLKSFLTVSDVMCRCSRGNGLRSQVAL
eukprot:827748-Amphidinium_carterae.1